MHRCRSHKPLHTLTLKARIPHPTYSRRPHDLSLDRQILTPRLALSLAGFGRLIPQFLRC